MTTLKLPERRVCRALGQHRSTQRQAPRGRDDEEQLTADLVELARQYGRLKLSGDVDLLGDSEISLGSILSDAQERGLVGRNAVREMTKARKKGGATERRQKVRLRVGV